jgi:ribosomal-protein-alanine N-acetyltransferase
LDSSEKVKAEERVIGDLLIRNCCFVDLSQVERIEKASFDDPYTAIIFWSLFLDPKVCFRVAINKDKVLVGYSIIKLETSKSTKQSHLVSIAIAQKFRRKGYGKTILRDSINLAKDKQSPRMILEVRADNESAISLYRKLGFVQESVIPSYYGNGEDALSFSLNLIKGI